MHLLPLRLKPGSDLRRSLEEASSQEGKVSSFVVSGIGSLSGATLRLAGDEAQTQLAGMFEILCLSGSISEDGAHLHMAVADSTGKVIGGHVCYGNEIRTTAEVLLAILPEWRLTRAADTATGFDELVVAPPAGNVA